MIDYIVFEGNACFDLAKTTKNYNNLFNFRDKFTISEDGYGRIVGRLKDIIIRGGENIAPKEIEDLLNTHPDIIESQVRNTYSNVLVKGERKTKQNGQ